MRGARTGTSNASVIAGIIPAYAGSTDRSQIVDGIHWDHPRVCGEHTDA